MEAQIEELDVHWLKILKHYISLSLGSGYESHELAANILTAEHGGYQN
jgi:hypothetical protein